MEEAFPVEQAERRARREGQPLANLGKHSIEAESSETAAKRAKTELTDVSASNDLNLSTPAPGPRLQPTTGREIDVSPLPEQMVIEMVIRGLEAISAEALTHILDVSQKSMNA